MENWIPLGTNITNEARKEWTMHLHPQRASMFSNERTIQFFGLVPLLTIPKWKILETPKLLHQNTYIFIKLLLTLVGSDSVMVELSSSCVSVTSDSTYKGCSRYQYNEWNFNYHQSCSPYECHLMDGPVFSLFNRNYLTIWLKWKKFPYLITSSDGVKGIDKLLNFTAVTAKAAAHPYL